MSFKYRYRKQIVISVIFILFISFLVIKINFLEKEEKIKKVDIEKTLINKPKKKVKNKLRQDNYESIMVDVKGEVINPGIYKLKTASRVIDAIEMAGGVSKNADTSIINLSKKLKDEMVIIVYSHYEVKNFKQTKKIEQVVEENCVNGYENIKNDACVTNNNGNENKEKANSVISINTATKEQLQTLPGVGEAKAQSIIDYRNKNGLFTKIEDIKNVSGIGEALFEKIKNNITL